MRLLMVFALVAVSHSSAAFSQDRDRADELLRDRAGSVQMGQAFSIDLNTTAPVNIVKVEQIKRPDGRSHFAVSVKNLSNAPVASYVVSAAIVGADGTVRAWQPLDAVKNLKPGQTRRQELIVRVAVPSLTDLVGFAVSEFQPETGEPWKAEPTALEAAMSRVSKRTSR